MPRARTQAKFKLLFFARANLDCVAKKKGPIVAMVGPCLKGRDFGPQFRVRELSIQRQIRYAAAL